MTGIAGSRLADEQTVRLHNRGLPGGTESMIGDTRFVLERLPHPDAAGRVLGSFILPLGIAGLSALLANGAAALPAAFHNLLLQAPYVALGTALVFSMAFKRGRVLFASLALMIAYGASRFVFESGTDGFVARTTYLALCLFVPLNLAFLSLLRERGALNAYGTRRFAMLVIEIGMVIAIIAGDHRDIVDALYRPLVADAGLAGSPIPQIALVIMAIALAVAVLRAAIGGSSVVEAALAVVILVFAGACNDTPGLEVFVWLTAAGTILTAAVVHDSYRMAFSDELTGLPGRRALNESLMGLERNYTIAMLDVDHFKKFNDTWGHDIGDQVLKLVATRLQHVGGGGRAYRYGGEEFTVVYPGRRQAEVLVHLDALRRDIEGYRLRIRHRHVLRANATREIEGRNIGTPGSNGTGDRSSWVSVTVSIGVAGKTDRLATPEDVIKAADEALYRAKSAGRNCVSR